MCNNKIFKIEAIYIDSWRSLCCHMPSNIAFLYADHASNIFVLVKVFKTIFRPRIFYISSVFFLHLLFVKKL